MFILDYDLNISFKRFYYFEIYIIGLNIFYDLRIDIYLLLILVKIYILL